MKISPQAVLLFQQEVRRQLVSLDLGPPNKVVNRIVSRTRLPRIQQRDLTIHRSPVLRQAVPASVPQHETISLDPPAETSFSSWEPFRSPAYAPTNRAPASLGHLPVSCPGCGALTQEVNADEAGFYTRSRKSVKDYIRLAKRVRAVSEHEVVRAGADQEKLLEDDSQQQDLRPRITGLDLDQGQQDRQAVVEQNVPFCDRCHNLLHQSKGVPIAHPTIESIAETIEESPFRRNHVYHVLDAADFPLSLTPSIFNRLSLARPRSQNRRSQHDFSTKPTISFIITRSDLLAPQKEMVDSLMPYFISVLRDALGRKGQDMRLGNVHLVSAKRGWWTKEIKESIYERGGGNWMVGKFNVGKSNLFEVLFPKGHDEQAPIYSQLQKDAEQDYSHLLSAPPSSLTDTPDHVLFSESSLLPPPQPSTPYPTLPLVSPLPGTTASPIRLPFGPSRTNPKGELIDLPGLPRGNLSHYVTPEHHRTLLMEHRPTVTQHVLKQGQSLLLGGGLMRITPLTTPTSNPNDETVILAYPFTPLPVHVTSTEKADMTQRQLRESGIKTLLAPEAGESIKSAGIFALDTDVTKSRSGALLRAGVPLSKLPFRVKGTDILLEGVGWVELVCQVRHRRRRGVQHEEGQAETRQNSDKEWNGGGADVGAGRRRDALSILDDPSPPPPPAPFSISSPSRPYNNPRYHGSRCQEDEFPTPQIEVFTPEGRSVGQRRTMGAWMLIHGARKPGQRKTRKSSLKARPRRSMKGMKKRGKMEERERARVREGGGAGGGEEG
ncbi:hypothetical protein EPUS_07346 [Endocarpon pusillum Z07020]|uniref:Genetic interactor of prohibitins 3, mitochondrial n=1 Tax=Endocarpon pusillum (strain Z07020 / HMAS-L-300199) TaxID=1263415 RepID=U1HJR1_ENDPU|nr:uncharacterized protein EPUS_07346 [Endocarpon pusillum Z07020]ERF70490.1 hypothetical protein EPUS_07346 [Endocarpon pusillum Z07020]